MPTPSPLSPPEHALEVQNREMKRIASLENARQQFLNLEEEQNPKKQFRNANSPFWEKEEKGQVEERGSKIKFSNVAERSSKISRRGTKFVTREIVDELDSSMVQEDVTKSNSSKYSSDFESDESVSPQPIEMKGSPQAPEPPKPVYYWDIGSQAVKKRDPDAVWRVFSDESRRLGRFNL